MNAMFRKLWSFSGNGAEEPTRDVWLGKALGVLDPVDGDPRYWSDFRQALLRAAAPELARRRRLSEVTVSDVVFSWSRALVPAAVMAGAAAVFLVTRPEMTEGPAPLRLEELLMEGLEVVGDPNDEVELRFASEIF